MCIKSLNKHSKVFLYSVLPKYRRSTGQILMPRFCIICNSILVVPKNKVELNKKAADI